MKLMVLAATLLCCTVASAGNPDTAPRKHIGVYVTPYYQAAETPEGRPVVEVNKEFDALLASGKKADIVAVRDAIQARPQRITPMTMMALAIRLYDVGLRDDAVFWFYVAKNRYLVLADVLDIPASGLGQVEDAVKNFALLAGPFFNSYAFCDMAKQRATSTRAIEWVEQNPYDAVFADKFVARPGDRKQNLKRAISNLKERAAKEQAYFDDPKNLETFQRTRKERHVDEQFCWAS